MSVSAIILKTDHLWEPKCVVLSNLSSYIPRSSAVDSAMDTSEVSSNSVSLGPVLLGDRSHRNGSLLSYHPHIISCYLPSHLAMSWGFHSHALHAHHPGIRVMVIYILTTYNDNTKDTGKE